jgi:hypothetical protein
MIKITPKYPENHQKITGILLFNTFLKGLKTLKI